MAIADHALDRGALSQATAALVTRVQPSVVSVRAAGRGLGAGVIWRPDGLVVTNAHVAHAARLAVVLADGREFAARLVARDRAHDLAALHVEAADLPAARIGAARPLRTGALVLAIGHPLGEPYAVALGIVQQPPRDATALLQAELALYPGNSGGPLVDAHGAVVGVASAVVPPRLALAVPSEAVVAFLHHLAPPRLGLRVVRVALPPPLVARLGLRDEHGLMVVAVRPESAAAAAGLLPGDILLAADDHPLRTVDHLAAALNTAPALLRLAVLRGGRVRPVVVVPQSSP